MIVMQKREYNFSPGLFGRIPNALIVYEAEDFSDQQETEFKCQNWLASNKC